ncbi:hypothetical protein GJR99_11605 [Haloferax sp. MBLA0078]|uniref:Uncharacterized protein n=2 Tax=Haloferacaceae TaxID=1644056 RepID=A0A6A8G811_9EURY|nr:hypothetical protein Hfx1150_11645 [Haloferax sp. CBA1150]MRW97214.1 hypothetical protein [Haloferax marinum]
MAFDPEDAAAAMATFIGASAMAGIASRSLFDVTLSDVAFNLGGSGVTLATLLTAAAFIFTVATNDNTSFSTLKEDAEKLDQWYYMADLLGSNIGLDWRHCDYPGGGWKV